MATAQLANKPSKKNGFMCSSLAKKYLMALTGLGWAGFVLSHMLGNLLIFVGPEAYNRYSHALISNPFLPVAEIGLVLLLLVHVGLAINLTIENNKARPQGYAVAPSGAKRASLASRTMAYTGSLVLAFIILHIINFKYGPEYTATYNGVEMRDLHRLVLEVFHSPGYVAWYVVALIFLGFHLSHGFASSFQSLGINHPRLNPVLKKAGLVYTLIVIAGFIAQPLYVFLVVR